MGNFNKRFKLGFRRIVCNVVVGGGIAAVVANSFEWSMTNHTINTHTKITQTSAKSLLQMFKIHSLKKPLFVFIFFNRWFRVNSLSNTWREKTLLVGNETRFVFDSILFLNIFSSHWNSKLFTFIFLFLNSLHQHSIVV